MFFAILLLAVSPAIPQDQPAKCEGLPPGRHANLERMAAGMSLTCEQQIKIEVLLHDEESVSKPLLRFTSFSADDRSGFMTKIKLAARRQIRTRLTPEQQKWMDADMESVAKSGKKGGGKAAADKAGTFDDQDVLSKAVLAYSALLPEERKAMVLSVKKAARNDGSLQLTPEQQKKLDAEIQDLSKTK